jgi:hypothetical protein
MAYVEVLDDSWTDRLKVRLEHHSSTILMIATALVIGIGLKPLPGVLNFFGPLALVTVVFVSFAMMRSHDRKLCELCLSDFPMTPAKDAKQLRRRLWLVHTLAEPRFMVLYVAALIGSNFVPGLVGRGIWAALQLSLIYLILSLQSHRRLQPWCPWADRSLMRKRLRKRRHSCTPAPQVS